MYGMAEELEDFAGGISNKYQQPLAF